MRRVMIRNLNSGIEGKEKKDYFVTIKRHSVLCPSFALSWMCC